MRDSRSLDWSGMRHASPPFPPLPPCSNENPEGRPCSKKKKSGAIGADFFQCQGSCGFSGSCFLLFTKTSVNLCFCFHKQHLPTF